MIFNLTACGRGYSLADKFAVRIKGRYHASAYLLSHKFGAFIYDLDNVGIWGGFFEPDSLCDMVNAYYFYKFQKHILVYNLADDSVYDDDLMEYACDCAGDIVSDKLELSENETVQIDYDPEFEIETTAFRTNVPRHPYTKKYKLFPVEYTETDVQDYVTNHQTKNNIDNIKIYSSQSVSEISKELTGDKYAKALDYSPYMTVVCDDGYATYEKDYNNDYGTGENNIIVSVFKNNSIIVDDKIRVDYYDTFLSYYRYDTASNDYVLLNTVSTVHNPDDFKIDYYGKQNNMFKVDAPVDCDIFLKGFYLFDIHVNTRHSDNASNSEYVKKNLATVSPDQSWKKIGSIHNQADKNSSTYIPKESYREFTTELNRVIVHGKFF
ncbi:MAG: hypothetical protein K5900_06480 [Butyrivibrio sp.]|nr:hypothetical protein [Butyrivibrio sp.]